MSACMGQAAVPAQPAPAPRALQDAARLRDRVQQLQPPPPPPPPAVELPSFDPTAVTVSDTVTDGIRVTCRSFFVPSESRPGASPPLFLFGWVRSERRVGRVCSWGRAGGEY